MPDHISIVSSSILSALAGRYGDYHSTPRTHGSKLWINPLMSIYWCFQSLPLARRIMYLETIKQTNTIVDVLWAVDRWRSPRQNVCEWENIPV